MLAGDLYSEHYRVISHLLQTRAYNFIRIFEVHVYTGRRVFNNARVSPRLEY